MMWKRQLYLYDGSEVRYSTRTSWQVVWHGGHYLLLQESSLGTRILLLFIPEQN